MMAQYNILYVCFLYFCVSCSGLLFRTRNRAGCFPTRFLQKAVDPSLTLLRRPHFFDGTLNEPRSPSSLPMFLPPGGGKNDKSSELREIASAILSFVGIALFFFSPLGGLFFALFNSFLAFVILLPIGAFAALNVWQYFNTVTGSCPNCGVGIKALKDESPTICLNCGSIIQAKDGQIYLANTNDDMKDAGSATSIFSTWMNELGNDRFLSFGDNGTDGSQASKRSRSSSRTVIDVEVKEVDD